MGLKIGNFFKNIGNAIKAEIKKVAPKVIDTLKKVAGDTFQKGKAIFDKAKTFVQDRIISPLKNGKLMDKLLGGLKGKFEQLFGSVEKGLKDLLSKVQTKTLENGQQVTTPKFEDRMNGFSDELKAIMEQVKNITGGSTTGSTTSASTATTTGSSATGSTSSAATSSTPRNDGSVNSLLSGMGASMAGLSSFQQDMLKQLKDGGADEKQITQMRVQMLMGNQDNLTNFISTIMKSRKDLDASMIRNF